MSCEVQGILLKCVGGFYYVEASDIIYECRARGVFRKQGITPMAGDHVLISVEEDQSATVCDVLERKNWLVRPPVANLDYLVVVVSIADPVPNLLVIDKVLVIAEHRAITPLVVINKSDLEETAWVADIYRKAGYDCFVISSTDPASVSSLKERLHGKVSAFTGNSGVGKSTILNQFDISHELETGQTSKKLGRGRHTTRIVSLYKMEQGGYIADTPGFSSLDMEKAENIRKEQLPDCFPEFHNYLGKCQFTSCSHTKEKGCKILEAVSAGDITTERHESYVAIYNDIKDIKDWQR